LHPASGLPEPARAFPPAALAVLAVAAAAQAEPAPVLAALVPAPDARESLAIGLHGEVYEPDGKGAWVCRHTTAIAADVAAATRGAGALALTNDGALFRLAGHAWTAVGLAPHAKAIVGAGARPIAAVGSTLFALDRVAPARLPDAPGPVAAIAASPTGAVIETDRGLMRLDGSSWRPIRAAPVHVLALVSDRFALVDRGVFDLSTGNTITWPTGASIVQAIANGDGLVAVASRDRALELVTLRAGKLASDPIAVDLPCEVVGLAADRAGRVVLALRDGRLAIRDRGTWSTVQVREEVQLPRPGPPPAQSR
jgi:hypothetical protein